MQVIGWILIIIGFFVGFDGLVLGKQVQFGSVVNFAQGMIGACFFISGILLIGFHKVALAVAPVGKEANPQQQLFDESWAVLVEYDADINAFSTQAKMLGKTAEKEMAKAFLTLQDKSYLPIILEVLQHKYEKSLKSFFETVYASNGVIICALLKDGRAIGFSDGRYRMFPDLLSFRTANKDSAVYRAVDNPTQIDAFVSGISYLYSEIRGVS